MTGRVSLPMYDLPGLQPVWDAWWRGMCREMAAAGVGGLDEGLTRLSDHMAHWRDPGMRLSQTCGYPLMTFLAGTVVPIGAPVYDLPGCEGTRHVSMIIVAENAPWTELADLRGSRAAMNGRDSNTGMNLLRRAVADLAGGKPFFSAVVETGGHVNSLAAVRAGEADVAAVDAVSYGLAAIHRPELVEGVRILCESPPSPTLPFITRASASDDERAILVEALAAVMADPALAPAREMLRLTAIAPVTTEDYAVLVRYEADAAALGYPELA